MGELYGEVDEFSKEWHDGLGSHIMRKYANKEDEIRRWVVFDGPVDAIWIENMNTVLDDNMMLCLANGQRIKLRNQMRMLFEVNDLEVASPATVSRCGMVYLSQDELDWRVYVNSWVDRVFGGETVVLRQMRTKKTFKEDEVVEKKELAVGRKSNLEPIDTGVLNSEQRKYLKSMFEIEALHELLTMIRTRMKEPIPTINLQLIVSLCNLLEVFISDKFGWKTIKADNQKRYLSYVFAFAFVWSVAITVGQEFQRKIDTFIRDKFASVLFPNNCDVFGCFLEMVDSEFNFKSWEEMKEEMEFQYDDNVPFFNLLVPTVDTVRYSYIIQWLLDFKKKIYLTGGTGAGKSVLVGSTLVTCKNERKIDSICFSFSAQTKANSIAATLESKLN